MRWAGEEVATRKGYTVLCCVLLGAALPAECLGETAVTSSYGRAVMEVSVLLWSWLYMCHTLHG
jgi:hypothetical protein